ncbi:MAG: SMC-Scp complex subunit ScpB [Chitinophagales bacterium]|nr:SMC-Scp complex subunit ScpB [Chitinophagales bacterium]
MEHLMPHIEALIFASERPLTTMEIADIMAQTIDEPLEPERIMGAVEAIREKYDASYYPFQLREVGGGYQFLTKKEYHKTVLQLNGDKHIKKLSVAAMETLAIIAYKQPITKAEIEHIRGVSVDYSIQKLLDKELISISGRKEDAVGKPLLYVTAKNFMDYLGINSPDDLPELKDISNIEIVVPTSGSDAEPGEPDGAVVMVGEDGSLKEENGG